MNTNMTQPAQRIDKLVGLGWHFLAASHVPRQSHEVFERSKRAL